MQSKPYIKNLLFEWYGLYKVFLKVLNYFCKNSYVSIDVNKKITQNLPKEYNVGENNFDKADAGPFFIVNIGNNKYKIGERVEIDACQVEFDYLGLPDLFIKYNKNRVNMLKYVVYSVFYFHLFGA